MQSAFPKLLKEARKEAGLTQKQLASMLGVATGTVQQWELSTRFPRVEMLEKLEEILGISFFPVRKDMEEIAKQLGVPFKSVYSVVDEGKDSIALDIIAKVHKTLEKNGKSQMRYEEFLRTLDNASHSALIMFAFEKLNDEGKKVAVERVEELTQIPKYQITSPTEPPETPETESKGNSSSTYENPSEGL